METSPPPAPQRSVWTVVVAGGSGQRYAARTATAEAAGVPKQYERIAGRRVLDHSVVTALRATDGVVVVVPADDVVAETDALAALVEPASDHGEDAARPTLRVVAGGATRSASVRAGLAAVPVEVEVVLIHDAARPAASVALYRRVIAALDGSAGSVGSAGDPESGSAVGAVPGVAVTDSMRHRSHGAVDRTELVAVQTPQGFLAAALRAAHAAADDATDDATVVERAGGRIVIVDGETDNIKLTHPGDRFRLEAALARSLDPVPTENAPAAQAPAGVGGGEVAP